MTAGPGKLDVRYAALAVVLLASLHTAYCQDPFIRNVLPTFGPVSGGTNIAIFGNNFGEGEHTNDTVKVTYGNHLPCKPQFSNATLIVCTTVPMGHSLLIGQPLKITVAIKEGTVDVPNNFNFTYRPDPIIENFQPRQTIQNGGLFMTVTGQNLDSVLVPVLAVSCTYRGNPVKNSPFREACSIPSRADRMLCKTPEIYLPGSIPESRSNFVNNEDLKFFIGFELDGVKKYENLSDTNLHDQNLLEVYQNPEVTNFQETSGLKSSIYIFKVYQTDSIYIHGSGFQLPILSKDDFEVTLGPVVCNVSELINNRIQCKPPREKPKISSDVNQRNGAIELMVKVGNLQFIPGYVKWEFYNPWIIYGSVIGVGGVLMIGLVVGVWLAIKRRHKTREKYKEPTPYTPSFDVMEHLNPELKMQIQDLLLKEEHLKMGSLIGKGQYGKVFSGQLADKYGSIHQKVAIKTIKDDFADMSEIEDFLREATVMKDFHHANILSILGIVIKDNKPLVILPFMANGDLKSYILMKHCEMLQLLNFGWQVACGMAYLETHRCVHRDLAARNCMVSEDLIVKVADFGLARDIYEKDYYRADKLKGRSLPVKWMALECLYGQVYTTKSDVWSYGVLLWELMSNGKSPYPDIDYIDMKRYLRDGRRLDRPPGTPDSVHSIMQQCWQYSPDHRPTFAKLADIMKYTLTSDQLLSDQPRSDYITLMSSTQPLDYIQTNGPPRDYGEYCN